MMALKGLLSIFVYMFCIGLSGTSEIYFGGTDHELEIIRLSGKKPGPTILIFGGIHGDEPGAHFSPELITSIKLKKGNLIIIPRVNYPGIMLNRRELHGDMNRKFTGNNNPNDPDSKVMKILKDLMKEADVFINQHDAHGFHRHKYISKLYNPYRYGQCLIVDTGKFYSQKQKKEIDLEHIGQQVVRRVNKRIKNKNHHFTFWNHNSLKKNTQHSDMRKSATYYALTTYSIPAFGLEVSKHLPTLDLKVKHQILMLYEIFRAFGLEFTGSDIQVKFPVLYWIELIKNGKDIVRMNNNTNLRLDLNDKVRFSRIFANYNSGLSANILNWGTLNDYNKTFTFDKVRTAIIKKNNYFIGKINFKPFLKYSIREIHLEKNGNPVVMPNWGKITIGEKDNFKIIGATPGNNFRFDLRGYQGKHGNDSGVTISPADLLRHYSFRKEGQIYFVKIYRSRSFAGSFQIEIKPQDREIIAQ